MKEIYTTTGELIDERTVSLDRPLPIGQQKVKLTVEQLDPASEDSYRRVIERLRTRQRARGHRPPSKADIDSYLNDERRDWDG